MTIEDETALSSETSGTNYYVMRRRTPEELKRQLRRLFGALM